jgi:hypothetical protein
MNFHRFVNFITFIESILKVNNTFRFNYIIVCDRYTVITIVFIQCACSNNYYNLLTILIPKITHSFRFKIFTHPSNYIIPYVNMRNYLSIFNEKITHIVRTNIIIQIFESQVTVILIIQLCVIFKEGNFFEIC